jgi:hypothetical protein
MTHGPHHGRAGDTNIAIRETKSQLKSAWKKIGRGLEIVFDLRKSSG